MCQGHYMTGLQIRSLTTDLWKQIVPKVNHCWFEIYSIAKISLTPRFNPKFHFNYFVSE